MGWGDEILVAGEAWRLQQTDSRPILVLNRHGCPRWHPLWEGNPRIVPPERFSAEEDVQRIVNGPRCRPYIDYEAMRLNFEKLFGGRPFKPKVRHPRLPWRFTNHRCTRGELYCIEHLAPQGIVIIEPHVKPIQVNRDWGWGRWQAVVRLLPTLDWVQINPPGARLLEGVRHMPAGTFPEACRLLSGAAAYLGPEGGLYHAAAVFRVPSVAIFGGYISPTNQGYGDAVNLYEPMDGDSPCGQRVPCEHCVAALARITPEAVADHLDQIVQ